MTHDRELEGCPFCGIALTIREGVNSSGRCDTEGCWMNARKCVVPFDDPRQVKAWNTRATLGVTEAMVEAGARAIMDRNGETEETDNCFGGYMSWRDYADESLACLTAALVSAPPAQARAMALEEAAKGLERMAAVQANGCCDSILREAAEAIRALTLPDAKEEEGR